MGFENFDELKDRISENKDLLTVSMEELRKAQGAGRLGKYVIEAIKNSLSNKGLDTFPKELPNNQNACVRVYASGSAVAKLYTAMTMLENQEEMEVNRTRDEDIREVVNADQAEIINKIQQLVCT